MAAIVATGANAQKPPPPEMRGTPKPTAPGDLPRSMEDIAEEDSRVLNYIKNNGSEDRYITEYIRAVRQFALNA